MEVPPSTMSLPSCSLSWCAVRSSLRVMPPMMNTTSRLPCSAQVLLSCAVLDLPHNV